MIVEFETSKGKFAVVKIPHRLSINSNDEKYPLYPFVDKNNILYVEVAVDWDYDNQWDITKQVQIPISKKGKYVGVVDNLTEEQWKEVVDDMSLSGWHLNYNMNIPKYRVDTATTSGYSLMESLNLPIGNWLLVKYENHIQK